MFRTTCDRNIWLNAFGKNKKDLGTLAAHRQEYLLNQRVLDLILSFQGILQRKGLINTSALEDCGS
jgi:hypothetical protein